MRDLDHSPADVVRYLLINLGIGTLPVAGQSVTWPVFAGSEPDAPDNCITLYDTVGTMAQRIQLDGSIVTRYGIQVRVRSVDGPTGWQKIAEIRRNLAEGILQDYVMISGTEYFIHAIVNIGTVLSAGTMPNSRRRLHTLNCQTLIEQT